MTDQSRPPKLIGLLDATLASLPDDDARRRWGRGLDYFRQKASETAGPRTSLIAQDIQEFLNEKHGLKHAAKTLPVALRDAVNRLKFECERIIRDEPVPAFAFGIVDGGQAAQRRQVDEFVDSLRQLEDEGSELMINVVFQLAGTISKPAWTGVHGGRLYPARRGMVINAAPPESITGDELDRFLVHTMDEAVKRTEQSLKRHHLAWSTEPHRRVLWRLHLPHIETVLGLMRESAPQDVVATIGWLEAEGWQARAAWGGPTKWEGNAGLAVEFGRNGTLITIVRDRGQWMIEIRPSGWKTAVDLGIIDDAIAGRSEWSGVRAVPNPVQLPAGLAWRTALPTALQWSWTKGRIGSSCYASCR